MPSYEQTEEWKNHPNVEKNLRAKYRLQERGAWDLKMRERERERDR